MAAQVLQDMTTQQNKIVEEADFGYNNIQLALGFLMRCAC
jgi:hypothetical protein